MSNEAKTTKRFCLEFSNRVIEHLGIKLYQNKPTNVVAEFLSNSWDADAKEVQIALTARGKDGHPTIVITDNGRGMTRDELTDEFLVIGRNRRATPNSTSAGGRPLMGRKGIGKLAGFGIAGTVDILSAPNPLLRTEGGSQLAAFYWLRFSLNDLVAASSNLHGEYHPEVIADGIDLEGIKQLVIKHGCEVDYKTFIENVDAGAGGVCVHLSNTTLKKAMNIDSLLQAMGRRFTVSMLRPDFVVKVNGKTITPEHALPPLHPFGFGDWTTPIEEDLVIGGISRKIKYWIKFVNLEGLDWSIGNPPIFRAR